MYTEKENLCETCEHLGSAKCQCTSDPCKNYQQRDASPVIILKLIIFVIVAFVFMIFLKYC